MTVTMRDGFEHLVVGVTAFFAALDEATEVLTGYRERAKQLTQGGGGANRVIFLPGDPSGAAGKIAPPRDVGRQILTENDVPIAEVRPVASWERQFTISVWGVDKDKPRDELAQSVATVALFEKTVQAIEQVAHAGGPNLEWGSVSWTLPREATFGSELLVSVQLAHPLMDVIAEVGVPGFTLKRTGEDA